MNFLSVVYVYQCFFLYFRWVFSLWTRVLLGARISEMTKMSFSCSSYPLSFSEQSSGTKFSESENIWLEVKIINICDWKVKIICHWYDNWCLWLENDYSFLCGTSLSRMNTGHWQVWFFLRLNIISLSASVKQQEEQMLKWSVFIIQNILFMFPYTINHHEHLSCVMQHLTQWLHMFKFFHDPMTLCEHQGHSNLNRTAEYSCA